MDANSEGTPLSIRDLLPPLNLHKLDWLPKGGDRFSPDTLLANLKAALKKPKFTFPLFAALSITTASINPLDVNPYPFWRDLILGAPKQTIVYSLDRKVPRIIEISPQDLKLSSDKTALEESIPEYLKSFAQNPERIKNTLRWKNLVEQIVADKRLNIPPSQRAFWVNHMLKIIFIESGGDPEASSGIAFGLTQLKPSTAAELAQKYRIREYDIYQNAWDNSFLGTAYQLEMAGRFGPEIGAWAHHLGQGSINQAIRTYLVSNLGLPVGLVEETLENNNLLLKYIKDYGINPEKLLASPAVTGKLKAIGAWGDLTWEYYLRYQAAGAGMGLKDTA